MWHLRKYLQQVPNIIRHNKTTIYISDDAFPHVNEAINDHLSGKNNSIVTVIEEEPGREVLLINSDRKYILKHGKIAHWKKKIFNAWGVKKNGCYRHLTHEFVTLTNINTKTRNAPVCHGFGYTIQSGCMFSDEYLLLEFIDNAVTLADIFSNGSYTEQQQEKALNTTLLLINDCVDSGVVHLDTHPGNILMDKHLESGRLIDFENCALSVFNKDMTLGFIYAHTLIRAHLRAAPINEALFNSVVNSTVKMIHLDDERLFYQAYNYFKSNRLSRKLRNRTFLLPTHHQKMLNKVSKNQTL